MVISILSLCQCVNGYTRMSLFPYVGFMVKHLLTLSTDEVGYYAGFIASAFTLGHLLTGYPWGYATDVIGRKPVVVIGLLSIAMFSVAFGFSPTFEWAVGSSRLMLGLLNAIVPAIRAMAREVCGPEHVIQGTAYFGGATGLGIALGSLIGGLMSQPADHYPSVFSPTGVFARFPYLFPNLFGASLALLLLPFVIFYVPETMGSISHPRSGIDDEDVFDSLNATNDDGSGEHVCPNGENFHEPIPQESAPAPGGGLLAMPHVKTFLILGFALQMVMIGFQEVYPLWALSTNGAGGLEWDTVQIGKVAFITGAFMLIGQLAIFPAMIKEIGIATWSRTGCLLAVGASALVPHAKALSWNKASLFAVSATSSTLVKFGESAVMIALTVGTTCVVPVHQRGKLSGLYSTAENFGRFLGPVSYAIMFAWSISDSAPRWVDHCFVFYQCAAVMLGVTVLSWNTLTSENLVTPASEGVEKSYGTLDNITTNAEQREGVDFVSSPTLNELKATMT
ncbi:unnamed protein product [Ascophyllum nodosum]